MTSFALVFCYPELDSDLGFWSQNSVKITWWDRLFGDLSNDEKNNMGGIK
jgi:hypothetical protein